MAPLTKSLLRIVCVIALLGLAACSGGGGGGGGNNSSGTTSTAGVWDQMNWDNKNWQ